MARSKYGTTPWGAWFLRMLESYDGDGRVSRGKSYANTGKVDSLVITGNKVAARVAGHYDPWYYITLTFPNISEPNRKKLEKILAEHQVDLVALENGTMTERLVELFEAKDVRLIPRRWSLIESDCSCPDSASLCKHIAAVLYILAKEIDHDPRLLFQLAGIDLAELREKLKPAASAVTIAPDASAVDTAALETLNVHTAVAAGQTAADNSPTAGTSRKARQSGTAALNTAETKASPADVPPEPEYEHPTPLSLRRADEPAQDVPAQLPRFPLEESFLPLISALLPPFAPFYDDDLVAAFKELYHKLIVRQNKEFDLTLEQRIAALMKSSTGSAAAAALCGSNRLLYTPVRLDTETLPKRKTGAPAFPLHKEATLRLLVRLPNGREAALTLVQALHLFRGVTPLTDSPEGVKAAYTILTLGERLVAESALLPAVFLDPVTRNLSIFWKPMTSAQGVSAAIDRCALFITESFFPQVKNWGRRYCAELLLTAFLTEYVHTTGFIPAGIRQAEQEIAALFFRGMTVNTKTPGARRLPASIARWLAALYYDSSSLRFRLILEEAKKSDFKISAEVCHSEATNNRFVPFSRIADYAQIESKTVEFAIALSAYLPKLTEMIGQKSVPLTQEETAVFLRTAAPLLSRFGIEVVLPKTLQRALKPRAVFQLKQKGAGAVQSYLSLDNLMDYDRGIMLGDTVISAKEFRALMKQSSGLVKFNDRYILVDPEHTARLLETMQHEKPDINEVIQGTLTGDTVMADGAPLSYSLFRETDAAVPQTLQATLRPYQQKGFQWLYSTIKSGFGCLLGDDMGLGKTLQVIALILKLKEQGFEHSGILIAAPASLLPNWEHELHTFAPSLRCTILHGQGRRFSAKSDIHITTYQTLQRDVKKLSEKTFDCLIIDEAQAVKNTQTKNAQALRLVQAKARIAMTGTPVENSLEDMRALFDFIIPGYLGSAESFRKKWRIPIELHGDADTAESFQKITAPFLLRRLKTDPAVISDLPEKVITPQYCCLTPEQTALYESLVDTQLKSVLKTEDGIKRNALVLKLLTALKQVCNHPHVYDESYKTDTALSGKTAALMQLLGEILDAGEKTLIFSQYTQTLFLVQKLITEQFGDEPLLLHGQMPLTARKAAVESFQTDPARRIFLISLKAGGTGLNLTAATRVIHFDLWYNPAIEDQATDRAFRIGQHNTVFVSRFICAGTFEEKIDEMIQKKRHISQMTLSGGESWIGKMSNEELAELFQ